MVSATATAESKAIRTIPNDAPPLPEASAYRRAAVEIRGVTKTFGTTIAVDNLSFSVRERSICGFIGPNGSGKTTTLRLIMRIHRPDEGAGIIRVLGRDDLRNVPDSVGYLPEERGLYRRMKVTDVLRFYAELKDCPNIDPLVSQWLEKMRLTNAANKRVEALSKGMAQKVQFIAAVINNPKLVILDEPFSGLDPVNANVLRDAILDLKRNGTTVIYSTHDMHMAEKMCDEIVMMFQGRKVLDGTLHEIREQYGADTLRVAFHEDDIDLSDLPDVNRISSFGRVFELQMNQGYTPKRALADLVRRGTVIHFEVTTPSLHDVFVRIASPHEQEAVNA
jgi:ABC-2 type transport system ATP-binding protein